MDRDENKPVPSDDSAATSTPSPRPAKLLEYDNRSSHVTRGQMRFFLLLLAVNTFLFAAFICLPSASPFLKQMWSDYQAGREKAKETAKLKGLIDACMNYSDPADALAYAEPPADARALLSATGRAITIDQLSHSQGGGGGGGGLFGGGGGGRRPLADAVATARWQPPALRGWCRELSDLHAVKGGAGSPPLGTIDDQSVVFLHGMTTPSGAKRLVWISFDPHLDVEGSAQDGSDDAVAKVYRLSITRTLKAYVLDPEVTSVVRTSANLTSSGALPSTLIIKPDRTVQMQLKDQWRIFAGRIDPADASHVTIAYDIDGKAGVIDGRLNDGDRLMLQPRVGALVTWGSGSEYVWDLAAARGPAATQPAATTRPSTDAAPPNRVSNSPNPPTSLSSPNGSIAPRAAYTIPITSRVESVSFPVIESLIALPNGTLPESSFRQTQIRPFKSISCPAGLNTYFSPSDPYRISIRSPTAAASRRDIGSPDCKDNRLLTSTRLLMRGKRPSRAAWARYSLDGLFRPEGLKPPLRSMSRTASFTCGGGNSSVARFAIRASSCEASSGGVGSTLTPRAIMMPAIKSSSPSRISMSIPKDYSYNERQAIPGATTMPLPPLSLEPVDVEQEEEASPVPAAKPAQQIPYEPGTQVSRRQFRFLLTLTLINTLMLGAFVAGPGISRTTGGWWKDYQNWRAARQAAQQRAAARASFMNTYQAALQFTAPAGQVVYEEDPQRAARLLQGNNDFVRVDCGGYIFFPPQPWQVPVFRQLSGPAAIPRPGAPCARLFLHSRSAPDGTERLVWVDLLGYASMRQISEDEGRRYYQLTTDQRCYQLMHRRMFFAHAFAPAAQENDLREVTTRRLTILQPEDRSPFIVWNKGASWENGTIEPHLRGVFRIFVGQPDPNDRSHFTITYELDGRPGVIDGWLRNDLTVVLAPQEGRVVRQDEAGLDQEWNPNADPPATRPSDPAQLVPAFVPKR